MAVIMVELCGRFADALGPTIAVTIPDDGLGILALRRLLADRQPSLARDLLNPRVRFCVDDVIVPDDANVLPGQVVALFPPLSGG
jgi:sulfur-carrier protein